MKRRLGRCKNPRCRRGNRLAMQPNMRQERSARLPKLTRSSGLFQTGQGATNPRMTVENVIKRHDLARPSRTVIACASSEAAGYAVLDGCPVARHPELPFVPPSRSLILKIAVHSTRKRRVCSTPLPSRGRTSGSRGRDSQNTVACGQADELARPSGR